MHPARPHAAPASFVLLAALLCGCPNPNTYGTPRTVAPGEFAFTMAVEGAGVIGETPAIVPEVPSSQLRIGAMERLDVGVFLANGSSLALDVKVNPLRGDFDLAFDPRVQYVFLNNEALFLHAPLLLGLNPSDVISIVLTPGMSYGALLTETERPPELVNKPLLRGGLGLNIRASKTFAVHPEITFLSTLDKPTVLYVVGLGFNFGALPSFSDIRGMDPMP